MEPVKIHQNLPYLENRDLSERHLGFQLRPLISLEDEVLIRNPSIVEKDPGGLGPAMGMMYECARFSGTNPPLTDSDRVQISPFHI
jgi:hypothetical protein